MKNTVFYHFQKKVEANQWNLINLPMEKQQIPRKLDSFFWKVNVNYSVIYFDATDCWFKGLTSMIKIVFEIQWK